MSTTPHKVGLSAIIEGDAVQKGCAWSRELAWPAAAEIGLHGSEEDRAAFLCAMFTHLVAMITAFDGADLARRILAAAEQAVVETDGLSDASAVATAAIARARRAA